MNQITDAPFAQTAAHTAVVGRDHAHESAHLHVAGSATYIDDLPELAGTLHAALGLSPVAHGRLKGIRLDALRALPGVVDVIAAEHIPGENQCGPIVHDDPILADGVVQFLGQPVFAVIASTRDAARRAAARAKDFVDIEALPAVLTVREAHAAQSYVVPPMHLTRESSPGACQRAIAGAPHRLQGSFVQGGQEQFYLEGQISYAVPLEGDGMRVHCSTQHPSEMQHVVAHALGVASHAVLVECRRMGGGFGGKESQSALFACIAAVAARRLNRPVKLRPDRDDDMMITGRRHGFEFDYQIGHDDAGRILGAEVTMICNAGFSADLSPPVMTRAICHFDNAYWLPEVAIHGFCAKTNTQSNTAFRGFGGPQGALIMELILERIARKLKLDPLQVRRANFYGQTTNNITPYRQTVTDNVIHALTDQLVATSDYATRREAAAAFNASSPLLKRGIALTPVKFGISFNVNHYNQAGALVHVYLDGSVLVNHGGTEMGQGLNTKVAMVVAHELGLPLARVRCSATDTSKVANTSATAASTGSDLNGKAAQDAARQIRDAAGRAGRHPPRRRCRQRALRGGARARCRRGPGLRRTGWPGLRGARAAVERRLLCHAGAALGPQHAHRPALLLLRLRRSGQRSHHRHADRRMEAAARRHPARRRQVAEPGHRHRPGRRRLHPGHGLADLRRAGLASEDRAHC